MSDATNARRDEALASRVARQRTQPEYAAGSPCIRTPQQQVDADRFDAAIQRQWAEVIQQLCKGLARLR